MGYTDSDYVEIIKKEEKKRREEQILHASRASVSSFAKETDYQSYPLQSMYFDPGMFSPTFSSPILASIFQSAVTDYAGQVYRLLPPTVSPL